MNDQKVLQALRAIVAAIVESIKEAGEFGAPGGIIYAALSAKGASLSQYQSIMDALVRSGKVTREGDLYFSA